MDNADPSEWEHIETGYLLARERVADSLLGMLTSLRGVYDGMPVDHYEHGIQTATLAEDAGASEELIVAALLHDVGKFICVDNHSGIIAEIFRPYVSPEITWILANHQLVQSKYYADVFGHDPDGWKALEEHPHFEQLMRFVDEWDQVAFDADFKSRPLDHFTPMVRRVFAEPLDGTIRAA